MILPWMMSFWGLSRRSIRRDESFRRVFDGHQTAIDGSARTISKQRASAAFFSGSEKAHHQMAIESPFIRITGFDGDVERIKTKPILIPPHEQCAGRPNVDSQSRMRLQIEPQRRVDWQDRGPTFHIFAAGIVPGGCSGPTRKWSKSRKSL